MNKFEFIAYALVIATTLHMILNVAFNPEWMIGDETIEAKVKDSIKEAVIETVTEPETEEPEMETVHFECVMGKPADIEDIYPQTTAAEEEEPEIPVYLVNGRELDPELYEYLRVTMSSMGLEWYFPYALCQIFQESSFDPYAEASNGQDKGLLQYRLKYWNEEDGDIYDPYAQIRVYCRTMHDKVREGLGICQIISDHYTGGVGYDADYVNNVVRWMNYVSRK